MNTLGRCSVIYNDDLTHILTCESPYHDAGEDFTEEMILADVDEVAAAGADIHMLQPGVGWCALWPSKVMPFEEHYRWTKERYGGPDTGFDAYMLAGGDIIGAFVKRCRERCTSPYISLRMNDYHGTELLNFSREQLADSGVAMTLFSSRFKMEHPEWWLGPEPKEAREATSPEVFKNSVPLRMQTRHARGLNWAIDNVREYKLAVLEEICANYEIDGLELDFMRNSVLFRMDETTSEQRREIMSDYCARVRQMLDRHARGGSRLRLGVRIPHHRAVHDSLGIDLAAWRAAGVDFFNLSCHYCCEQMTQLPEIMKEIPEADCYLEMTQTSMRLWRDGVEDFRMTTREQFRTAAMVARAQGAAGISLFNFMYYRPHGERGEAVYSEPPFDVIKDIRDSEVLASSDSHYYIGPGSNNWRTSDFHLPRPLRCDQAETFDMTLVAPSGGWLQPGKLRLQLSAPAPNCRIAASMNGVDLDASPDCSEPYENVYVSGGGLGRPGELTAWSVPPNVPRNGRNAITFKLNGADNVNMQFIDLALPVNERGW